MIGGALFRAREQIIFLRKPRSKNYDNAHHSLPLNSSFPSAAMAGLFQPFVAAFEGLGDRLRDGVGGWEVRFVSHAIQLPTGVNVTLGVLLLRPAGCALWHQAHERFVRDDH